MTLYDLWDRLHDKKIVLLKHIHLGRVPISLEYNTFALDRDYVESEHVIIVRDARSANSKVCWTIPDALDILCDMEIIYSHLSCMTGSIIDDNPLLCIHAIHDGKEYAIGIPGVTYKLSKS